MAVLKNRAKMSTSTTGTGTITLGSAESGYQSFADAGVTNADVVRYVIEDTGGAFEIGTGTYTASGTTLSRTVSESSNSNNAINLSGSATVFIGATAEDIPALYAENYDGTSTLPSATGTNALSLAPLSTSTGINSVSIGSSADATGDQAFSFGVNSTASGLRSISWGSSSFTNNIDAVAIGPSAQAQSVGGLALGHDATVITGAQAVAIGDSYASGADSLAAAISTNSSTYGASGANSIAMGYRAKASHSNSTSIGRNSSTTNSDAVAIGTTATVSAGGGLALGLSTNVAHSNSVALGANVSTTAANQVSIGSTSATVRISESYTLPTSDGTNGQVLTSDGNGAVTFADAGGGGGADLYAANPSSATDPSAGGNNSIAIGSAAVTTNTNSIAIGTSSDADAGGVAIGYSTHANSGAVAIGGLTYGANANGAGSVAIGGFIADAVASTSYAVAIGEGTDATGVGSLAIGNDAQAASGQRATALTKSYASGTDSLAAAIGNNTSSYGAAGANSISMGRHAKTGHSYAAVVGGDTNLTSATYATVIGGYGNEASKSYTSTVGSFFALADIYGKSAKASGRFGSAGDAQGGQFILRAETTDATATVLTTNNSSAASTNQIVAASDTCITFDGTITAMQNGAQAYASWRIEGLLVNDGGTTTLANSATTVIQNSSGWGMALSADNTNNALAITCTGEASHNIRWVANIRTTECTFA